MQADSAKVISRSGRVFALAAAVLFGFSTAGDAQWGQRPQQQAQQPQPQAAPQQLQADQPQQQAQQPKAPWTKLCDKIQVPADKPAEGGAQGQPAPKAANLCVTLQERVNNTDGALVFSGSVRQQEGTEGDYLTVIVPLGLDLRGGVQAKIDNGKPIKLEYMSCVQVGCTAETKLPAGALQSMKTGKELIIEVMAPNKRPVRFSLPLTGFATTLEGPASDLRQYQMSRQQVVATIRARRQQEIQQAVEEADRRRAQQQMQQQQAQPQAPQPAPAQPAPAQPQP
jgi:invasion protein IalB